MTILPNMVLANLPASARFIVLEPGDATHYEFLVARRDNLVSVCSEDLGSFTFDIEDHAFFVSFYDDVDLFTSFKGASYSDYRGWTIHALSHYLPREILADSARNSSRTINPFTVIAGLVAYEICKGDLQ